MHLGVWEGIQPLYAIGHKNYLCIGTPEVGQRAVVLYTPC